MAVWDIHFCIPEKNLSTLNLKMLLFLEFGSSQVRATVADSIYPEFRMGCEAIAARGEKLHGDQTLL